MHISMRPAAGATPALILLCRLGGTPAAAREEHRDWGAPQGEDIPTLNAGQEQALDSVQEMASRQLMEAADWIDSFFDDKRIVVEENTSRATAKLAMGYSRNDNFEIKPRLDLRLKLPRSVQTAEPVHRSCRGQGSSTETCAPGTPATKAVGGPAISPRPRRTFPAARCSKNTGLSLPQKIAPLDIFLFLS